MVIHVVVIFTWLPGLQCTWTAVHWQIWLIVTSRSFAECPNTPLSIATGRHYTIAIFTLQPIQNNPVDIGRLIHPEGRTDEECYHHDNPVEREERKGGGAGDTCHGRHCSYSTDFYENIQRYTSLPIKLTILVLGLASRQLLFLLEHHDLDLHTKCDLVAGIRDTNEGNNKHVKRSPLPRRPYKFHITVCASFTATYDLALFPGWMPWQLL